METWCGEHTGQEQNQAHAAMCLSSRRTAQALAQQPMGCAQDLEFCDGGPGQARQIREAGGFVCALEHSCFQRARPQGE